MRNDVVSKQNLIDSLLEHNLNLLNHQCCRVIQDNQFNLRSGINTDIADNHLNNHGVNTITNEKTNKQPPLIKITIKQQYIKITMIVTWLNDKERSKERSFYYRRFDDQVRKWATSFS